MVSDDDSIVSDPKFHCLSVVSLSFVEQRLQTTLVFLMIVFGWTLRGLTNGFL